ERNQEPVRTAFCLVALATLPLAAPAQLVITEIMYNPGSSETVYSETQYVELANVSGAPLDITGYDLGDSSGTPIYHTLPSTPVIPVNGIVVICGSSAADFEAHWGAMPSGVTLISLADD